MSIKFKQWCNTCDAICICKRAFGRFWTSKSRGGIGCNNPLETPKRHGVDAKKNEKLIQEKLIQEELKI